MEALNVAITIVGSILGGGALVTLIQFLINRHDKKNDKYEGILTEIKGVKREIDDLRYQFNEDRATNARIRILQFSDDLRHNIQRSKESFDQVHQDIDMYNKYCREHAEYENSKAVAAIKYIETIYQECMEQKGFLN